MLIHVNYADNRFDYIKDHMLHGLIESRAIARFRRSSGWVTVGVGPLRQFQRNFKTVPVAEVKTMIRVAYDDSRYDYVTDTMLTSLIETNKIMKFKRITGWVTVAVDPLRAARREYTYRYPNEMKKRVV